MIQGVGGGGFCAGEDCVVVGVDFVVENDSR